MFNSSTDEWVAGLDVEYTTVLGREKDLKDEERKKPAVIQVCMHDLCLIYHNAMPTLSARILRTSSRAT